MLDSTYINLSPVCQLANDLGKFPLVMASLAAYFNWRTSRLTGAILGVLCLLGFSFGSFCLLRLDVSCRKLHEASCLSAQQALCVLKLMGLNFTDTYTSTTTQIGTQTNVCDDNTMESLREMMYDKTRMDTLHT